MAQYLREASMVRHTLLLAATFSVTLGVGCAPGDFLSGGGGDAAIGDDGSDDGADEGGDESDYPAAGGYGMDLGSGYPGLGDSVGETDQDAGAVFDATTNG
jgi:hypothetical protein